MTKRNAQTQRKALFGFIGSWIGKTTDAMRHVAFGVGQLAVLHAECPSLGKLDEDVQTATGGVHVVEADRLKRSGAVMIALGFDSADSVPSGTANRALAHFYRFIAGGVTEESVSVLQGAYAEAVKRSKGSRITDAIAEAVADELKPGTRGDAKGKSKSKGKSAAKKGATVEEAQVTDEVDEAATRSALGTITRFVKKMSDDHGIAPDATRLIMLTTANLAQRVGPVNVTAALTGTKSNKSDS